MMAFTLHCWRNLLASLRRGLFGLMLLWGVVAMLPVPAHAAGSVEFRYAELVASDQDYVINAAINLQNKPRLQEMIEAGVSVPFRAEVIITRPRWYWFNETISERSLDLKLSYHALTRQYRVSVGNLHRNFTSYDEAMRALLSLHNWAVADRSRLNEGESYQVGLRFRLDINSLAKPFQVAALGSHDLDLNTGWVTWVLQVPKDAR
ncbi:DUF4390 domain-containing protein [Uliginosibacterium gangwonense]|uniref:DUF4390 domain-containing protein n=1 Tax=Uliginosibacterium gangwonense TaxID=392736 RepID=UPI001FE10A2F|nr:DUF4390 domain-containing protein [Uliginosibacterium gangwonense]